MSSDDPTALTLDALRAERASLQRDDDAISYVRRLAQARLDLVRAERSRRSAGSAGAVSDDLSAILGSHLVGGSARPPRPADDFSDHPLARELDELCATLGASQLGELDESDLDALEAGLADFESRRSTERRAVFTRIDALSAELVRRYRDGEADVAGLLADD